MTLHPHRAAAPRDRWRAPGLPVSVPWCPSASFFQRDSGLAVPGFPLLGSGNRRLLAGTPHLWAHLAGYRGLGLASGRGGTHSVHDLLTDVDRAVLSRGHCGVTVSGVRRACVCVPSGAGGDMPTCPVLPSQRVTWLQGTLLFLLTLKLAFLVGIQSSTACCSLLLRRSRAGICTAGVRGLPRAGSLPDEPAQSMFSLGRHEPRGWAIQHPGVVLDHGCWWF